MDNHRDLRVEHLSDVLLMERSRSYDALSATRDDRTDAVSCTAAREVAIGRVDNVTVETL